MELKCAQYVLLCLGVEFSLLLQRMVPQCLLGGYRSAMYFSSLKSPSTGIAHSTMDSSGVREL